MLPMTVFYSMPIRMLPGNKYLRAKLTFPLLRLYQYNSGFTRHGNIGIPYLSVKVKGYLNKKIPRSCGAPTPTRPGAGSGEATVGYLHRRSDAGAQ